MLNNKDRIWINKEIEERITYIKEIQLPKLLRMQNQLEDYGYYKAIDGEIIGTGEADFTKGNTVYCFNDNNRNFQLLDVPGIEGNESKYEVFVKQAIAKAHLVFYVNGTNKKPEKATLEKIKHYLRRYAKVFVVCNVRGKGSAYENSEDCIDLETTHKHSQEVLKQTVYELEKNLGPGVLSGASNVQGLIAFSALAYTPNKVSTINSSRKDLIRAQKGYLSDFKSVFQMKSFSKIDVLHDVILRKLDTYKVDIVESNKRKLLELLQDNLKVLNEARIVNIELTTNIKRQVKFFQEELNECLSTFKDTYSKSRKNYFNTYFLDIDNLTTSLVIEHNAKVKFIKPELNMKMENLSCKFKEDLEMLNESTLNELDTNIKRVLKRFADNITQLKEVFLFSSKDNFYSEPLEVCESPLNLKMIVVSLFNILDYVFSGAAIGTLFPGPGNIIGAVLGGIIGAIMEGIKYFKSNETKIRDLQKSIQKEVNSQKREFQLRYDNQTRICLADVEKFVNENIVKNILYKEVTKLEEVTKVLEKQIKTFSLTIYQIKQKPYGTI